MVWHGNAMCSFAQRWQGAVVNGRTQLFTFSRKGLKILKNILGKKYSYEIPHIPPSNNKFIGRENRWEYQKIKKEWAQLIALTCLPKPRKPIQHAVVRVTYHFKDKRRRDPDNYSGKMILDGLVRAGIIADDSFFCIDLQLAAVYDNGGYTQITIQEVKQDVQ